MTSHPGPKTDNPRDVFKRDYEFVKPHSIKSPLNKWEHRYKTQDHPWQDTPTIERQMLEGAPHEFRGSKKQGMLRVSGKKGSHQIGLRKKK